MKVVGLILLAVFAFALFGISSVSSSSLTTEEKEMGGKNGGGGHSHHTEVLPNVTQIIFKRNCNEDCSSFESRYLDTDVAFWSGPQADEKKTSETYQAHINRIQFQHLVSILSAKNFFEMVEQGGGEEEGSKSIEVAVVWKEAGRPLIKVIRVFDDSLAALEVSIEDLNSDLEWIPLPTGSQIQSIHQRTISCQHEPDNNKNNNKKEENENLGRELECETVKEIDLHRGYALLTLGQVVTNLSFAEARFDELAYSFITGGFFVMPKEYGRKKELAEEMRGDSVQYRQYFINYYSTFDEPERKSVSFFEDDVPAEFVPFEKAWTAAASDLDSKINLMSEINLFGLIMCAVTLCILVGSIAVAIKVMCAKKSATASSDYDIVKDIDHSKAPALVFKKERPVL